MHDVDVNADCEECSDPLGSPQALFYDGALLSCLGCRAVYQVSADSEGLHLMYVAAPCGYCGTLTHDGSPCDPWCAADATNRVTLEVCDG